MPSHRRDRLNRDLKKELSELIPTMKDPRIDSLLSVMRVEVTNDLSYAKIYIGSIKGSKAAAEACEVLRKAAGHLRSQLSSRIHIRKTPELQFIPDDSAEYAERINTIIKGLNQ